MHSQRACLWQGFEITDGPHFFLEGCMTGQKEMCVFAMLQRSHSVGQLLSSYLNTAKARLYIRGAASSICRGVPKRCCSQPRQPSSDLLWSRCQRPDSKDPFSFRLSRCFCTPLLGTAEVRQQDVPFELPGEDCRGVVCRTQGGGGGSDRRQGNASRMGAVVA